MGPQRGPPGNKRRKNTAPSIPGLLEIAQLVGDDTVTKRQKKAMENRNLVLAGATAQKKHKMSMAKVTGMEAKAKKRERDARAMALEMGLYRVVENPHTGRKKKIAQTEQLLKDKGNIHVTLADIDARGARDLQAARRTVHQGRKRTAEGGLGGSFRDGVLHISKQVRREQASKLRRQPSGPVKRQRRKMIRSNYKS